MPGGETPSGGTSNPVPQQPATGGGSGDQSPPPERPDFHKFFAVSAAVVAIVIAVLVLKSYVDGHLGLTNAEWKGLGSRAQFAAGATVPIIVVGVVLITGGAWMAAVEWRGTFKRSEPDAAGAFDVGAVEKIIAAVGALKGAGLVLIAGSLLLLSASWVATNAAKPDPAPTTTTTSSPK